MLVLSPGVPPDTDVTPEGTGVSSVVVLSSTVVALWAVVVLKVVGLYFLNF